MEERVMSPDTLLSPAPESKAVFINTINVTTGMFPYMKMIQMSNLSAWETPTFDSTQLVLLSSWFLARSLQAVRGHFLFFVPEIWDFQRKINEGTKMQLNLLFTTFSETSRSQESRLPDDSFLFIKCSFLASSNSFILRCKLLIHKKRQTCHFDYSKIFAVSRSFSDEISRRFERSESVQVHQGEVLWSSLERFRIFVELNVQYIRLVLRLDLGIPGTWQ